MGKIIRYEFVGNKWLFFLGCILGFTIPFAIIYLINWTVVVEEEFENPTEFLEAFRAGKIGRQ